MKFNCPETFQRILAACICLLGCSFCFSADDKLPERLDGVYIDEKLDGEIPLNVEFMDDRGGTVSFGGLLKDGLPLVLTLNYSDCPGLCVAQLNGLSKGINEVGSLSLGKDFKMVSLSINPREARDRAASTKRRYSEALANHHKVEGWSFLVGNEPNIRQIAKAVGFNYTYDAKHNRYNHAAAAIFISPKGRITRYLYEVGFTPDTLKMALVESGEGKIGSFLDSFVLRCFHYDANENRYSANGKTLLSVAAGLFISVGLVFSLPFWISWRRGGGKSANDIHEATNQTTKDSDTPSP